MKSGGLFKPICVSFSSQDYVQEGESALGGPYHEASHEFMQTCGKPLYFGKENCKMKETL